jgi:hypothetical protein
MTPADQISEMKPSYPESKTTLENIKKELEVPPVHNNLKFHKQSWIILFFLLCPHSKLLKNQNLKEIREMKRNQ